MLDEAARANHQLWTNEVGRGCGYTTPWLDIDREILQRYLTGDLQSLPEPMDTIFPATILAEAVGKEVLCLASGGGQQSAVFGLLGMKVTVVDFVENQLAGDRLAAAHYGYEVCTVQTDMRDLSPLEDETFDLVYQPPSLAYVPELEPVYREVSRVLRRGGVYRFDVYNPAVFVTQWNGQAYTVAVPYSQKVYYRPDGGVEFRHYLDEIFNGLMACDMRLANVIDPRHEPLYKVGATPGSWAHERAYIQGGFTVIARKTRGSKP